MSLPSIDFQCEIDQEADQAYHHGHSLVDLYQSQAHSFPRIPPTSDWGWNEGARPGLTSAPSSQNLVASSWVMPVVGESTGWDAPPSTYGVYGTLSGIPHHAPNTGLGHFSDGTPVTLSHAGYLSSLSPRMEKPSQEKFEQDICNDDVHHPVVRSERQAHSQITGKNTRGPQLSQGSPTTYPIRCQWEGCRYAGSFKRESSLIRHLRNIHFAPGAHPCPIQDCNMVCNRADNLMQHMRNVHN